MEPERLGVDTVGELKKLTPTPNFEKFVTPTELNV